VVAVRPRVIPVVLLKDRYVVKTTAYRKPSYVGDPINTVKLFNEKGADELVMLDIAAGRTAASTDFRFVEEIVSEAFMPIAYGGGVRTAEEARRLLSLGVEKVVLNTALFDTPRVVEQVAGEQGAQAVVASIDVGQTRFMRRMTVLRDGGRRATNLDAVSWAVELERRGAGEILLTSVPREGSRRGYDLDLVRSIAEAVSVPVVAHGGAGSLQHLREVVDAGASAAAAAGLFVFHGDRRAVLITYPGEADLRTTFDGVHS